jgi:hypothetical protein
MRVRPIVLVLCVVALAVGACGSSDSSSKAAPELKDPTASARPLVTRLFELTQKKDASGLREFLSPAFQVERADGSGATKDAFLANLTTIRSFTLTDLAATQAGSTLIVRYLAQAEGLVNDKPYKPGPAPRLTVFHWNGKAWQVAAHANFNPLTG